MADNKSAPSKKIDDGEHVGPPTVQSTTEATPSPADETSMPNELNRINEQPPVRTAKPDTPIAQTLVAGAGEHTPPDPKKYDRQGRPVEVSGGPSVADADKAQADASK